MRVMKKHEEAIQVITDRIGLLQTNLREDGGKMTEEEKHHLRKRIYLLEMTKMGLVIDQENSGGKPF